MFEKFSQKLSMTLVAVALSLGSVHARAEEMKIGTVDMQKALQSVEEGKKAKASLQKEFDAKKKELQTEEAAIRKMSEDFKKQSLVMSEEARAKKGGELQDRIMKFRENTERSQMAIQKKEGELTEPLIRRLRAVITDVAKQKGYTLILERNENTVLFSQEKDDLTGEIISAFNKQKG
jgi:outer membrane protein